MEMIYDNGLVGDDNFSRMLNAVFLNLPAAEAVRRRMTTMRREMNALAPGSRVLNLACGSARELAGVDNAITVDLADHDTHALAHAARHRNGVAADLLQLNAFEYIKGRRRFDTIDGGTIDLADRRYDLVYSSGLFDYVPVFADNPGRGAPALVAGLFDLLKPGGRLVVGNFAAASDNNPHLPSHRLMMELYAEWFLIYRNRAEMIDLARNLSPQAMSMRILNERFAEPDIEPTTIWFLEITRNA
ncbi:MAG: class I SAM-dependent methyltransferase [Phyllobacteriaceae bacterium]|nr:class I SAM-dependent methyltransferase [Phyllobacteriaceae bacterium]